MKEITFELTNFCPFSCRYCSSNATTDKSKAIFINIERIKEILKGKFYNRIIISGGFYEIYQLCRKHSNDVPVYSNLITHRVYNPNVIDSVYLEANLTLLPNVNKIHILKRIEQGKELSRPEVKFSRNYTENCRCNNKVVIPDGNIVASPCSKFSEEKYIPSKTIYIVGSHGVGKSTLIDNIIDKLNLFFYKNNTRNPYKKDVKRRQLWRLYKYKFDEDVIKSFNKECVVINRCHLDWLVYTESFKDLGWITNSDYNSLIKVYDETFVNTIPGNIFYINPSIKWSKKRILERWKSFGMKWKEDDFEYYEIVRENYDKIFSNMENITNIKEIKYTNINKRINEFKKFVAKI
jgi:deoxyadenosine/deoxycytidine kinase